MSDKPAFSNPRVHVLMMDGSEWDAQTMNPDLLKFERTAVRHKWPKPGDSPVMWLTFIAWAAGVREGHIPSSMTWEQFSQELCAEVTNPDGKAAGTPVDPIPPGVDTD